MESKNISQPYRISTSSTITTTTLYQEKKNFQMGPPPFSSPSDHQIFTPDSQNFTSIPPHHYQLLHHQSNRSDEFYPRVISPGFVYPSMFPPFPLMVDQNRADHHILPTSLMGGFFDGVFPNKQIDQNQMQSSPTVVPELHLPEQWDSSISKAARSKRRMARQISSNHTSMLGNLFSSITSSSGRPSRRKRPSSSSTAIPNNNKDFYTFITPDNKQLQFILQKELKHSDVSSLGRIVLPKQDSEANLPCVKVKEGIQIIGREVEFSRLWYMRYRFWPNNKSRMYVLENTGDFVRQNELKRGDFIMLYKDDEEKLYISCKKAKQASSVPLEEEESERQVNTSSPSSSAKKFNKTVTDEGTLINKAFHGASSTTQLKMGSVDHEVSCIKDVLKEGNSLQLEDSFFFDIDRCDFGKLERFQDFDDCDLSLYDDIVKDFNGMGMLIKGGNNVVVLK